MSVKRSWQQLARGMTRRVEEELGSDRMREHLEGAQIAVDQALKSDRAKEIRLDAEDLGSRARSEVEKTLERQEIQRIREGAVNLGARAIHAVGEVIQSPVAENLRYRAKSVINDATEGLRPQSLKESGTEPLSPDLGEPEDPPAP